MKNGPFIFDSYALLKVFQKEKGHENIVSLLGNIKKTRVTKYINIINVGEIIYTTKREFGDQKKLEVLASIERLNFTILQATNSLVYQAAEYKAQYRISYADCFVLASAIEHKATIVTGDPEFKKVKPLVKVEWI